MAFTLAAKSFCTLWLFFLQLLQLICFSFSSPAGNETDRLSLLAFKAQISDDPLGTLSSWNASSHFCQWSGVTCGLRHRRVVELDLSSRKLVGSLSPHIGNLSFLRTLNLGNNNFTDGIPSELGSLFRLKFLSLENNTFSGEIPFNISRCADLSILYLGKNKLTGKLPAELGSLSKLKVLDFPFNNLDGEIPHSFGNFSSIETIHGDKNRLKGGIPPSIGHLRRLKRFLLAENNLSGIIPSSMFNLSSLTIVSFSINQLQGSLPLDLGHKLPNLEVFKVYYNQLNGQIPLTFSNCSNLSYVDLAYNFFTGKVPTLANLPKLQLFMIDENLLGNGAEDDLSFLHTLANDTKLEVLAINENNFGGLLPETVSNLTTLRKMAIGRNQIRGSIPTDIGNLVRLDVLGFEYNHLTGIIPRSIGKLQNLVLLNLNGNHLSGSVPSVLGNITTLLDIVFEDNNLNGSIPASLGNCRHVVYLNLAQNNLTGPIPKDVIGLLSNLIGLNLSQNQLTGLLPAEVSKLQQVGFLDVSQNRLSDEVPESLGSCVSLETLYLNGNFFHGPIPESLSELKAIQVLKLSSNNLSGKIPKALGNLKLLQYLDLSFNDLEGEVPTQGVFKNASGILLLGNKKLCGGMPKLHLLRCPSNVLAKTKSTTKLILMVIGAFLGIILLASFLLFYCLRRRKHKASVPLWEVSFQRVTYEALLRATNGFSSTNLIGAGSFGSVYKGILAPDGVVVAVKVFNMLQKGSSKSFTAECATLVNVRHRNLVKVLTVCSSIDLKGNDFKALVYEFMVNGSLEEWLHPVQISNETNEPRSLNLLQRLNIAIDMASALDYLHHQCEMQIVHCDLKPSNVLLDGDMIAHVGDFGLARFLLEASPQLSSNQSSSVGLKGTVGYPAPEYGMGSEVSTYGDVYSYGILLLEMFTGKRPTDGIFKDELNLHNFAKMGLPDSVAKVLDPILVREAEETVANEASSSRDHNRIGKIGECLISIIKVGVACSVESPRERISISNVASELNRIRSILLGPRTRRQRAIIVASEGSNTAGARLR